MNVVHHCGILHNDLSKDHIMLHFPLDKLNVVYISMCDWGEPRCLQEVMPSLYGFAMEQYAAIIKNCVGGLLQICFLFTASWELQIPLDEWLSQTPQLWSLKHIQWASWQMSYWVNDYISGN